MNVMSDFNRSFHQFAILCYEVNKVDVATDCSPKRIHLASLPCRNTLSLNQPKEFSQCETQAPPNVAKRGMIRFRSIVTARERGKWSEGPTNQLRLLS